jgi:hypothetical protein
MTGLGAERCGRKARKRIGVSGGLHDPIVPRHALRNVNLAMRKRR